MIIVSQDKKAIYNFDNISSIQIEECNGTYNLIVYDQINDRDSLGEYKSKERAREVLGEIIEAYNKSNEDFYAQESEIHLKEGVKYLVGYRNKNTNKTYYMPLQ